jgi:RNA polymerase sigma-70 factor (ECF subfamily)
MMTTHPDPADADTLRAAYLAYARTRDPRDLETVLAGVAAAAWAQAARHLGPGADAEDAVQEAFIALAQDARRYDGRIPAGAWVGRLVLVACWRIQRGGARRRRREAAAMTAPAPADPVGARLDRSEDHAAVRGAVARLPAKDQEVIALHYFAGIPIAAIADLLGLREGSVAMRLSRARARLRGDPALRPDHAAVAALLAAPMPAVPPAVGTAAREITARVAAGDTLPAAATTASWNGLVLAGAALLVGGAVAWMAGAGDPPPASADPVSATAPAQPAPPATWGPGTVRTADLAAVLRQVRRQGTVIVLPGPDPLAAGELDLPGVPESLRGRPLDAERLVAALADLHGFRVLRPPPAAGAPAPVVLVRAVPAAERDRIDRWLTDTDPAQVGMGIAAAAVLQDAGAVDRLVALAGHPDPRIVTGVLAAFDRIGWATVLALSPAARERVEGWWRDRPAGRTDLVTAGGYLGLPQARAWPGRVEPRRWTPGCDAALALLDPDAFINDITSRETGPHPMRFAPRGLAVAMLADGPLERLMAGGHAVDLFRAMPEDRLAWGVSATACRRVMAADAAQDPSSPWKRPGVRSRAERLLAPSRGLDLEALRRLGPADPRWSEVIPDPVPPAVLAWIRTLPAPSAVADGPGAVAIHPRPSGGPDARAQAVIAALPRLGPTAGDVVERHLGAAGTRAALAAWAAMGGEPGERGVAAVLDHGDGDAQASAWVAVATLDPGRQRRVVSGWLVRRGSALPPAYAPGPVTATAARLAESLVGPVLDQSQAVARFAAASAADLRAMHRAMGHDPDLALHRIRVRVWAAVADPAGLDPADPALQADQAILAAALPRVLARDPALIAGVLAPLLTDADPGVRRVARRILPPGAALALAEPLVRAAALVADPAEGWELLGPLQAGLPPAEAARLRAGFAERWPEFHAGPSEAIPGGATLPTPAGSSAF